MGSLRLQPSARRDLRRLSETDRAAIVVALEKLALENAGDVIKLHGRKNEYRLRVGRFRAIFTRDAGILFVLRVLERKEAY